MKVNVLEYLEETREKIPGKTAFIDAVGSVDFTELVNKGKSLGCYIQRMLGGKRGCPVMVLVNRNISSIISFLGVLYSGNFYVPIDNQTPETRLNSIATSLLPAAYIVPPGDEKVTICQEKLNSHCVEIAYEEAIKEKVDDGLLENIRAASIDTDPVYVMFTSGSTGIPKGVTITHRGIIDLMEWLKETFGFSETDIIGNQTPFYFDASVKDIYTCFRTGATVDIIPKNLFAMPVRLVQHLNERKINTIMWATSAIKLLANLDVFKEIKPEYLCRIVFAGENMPGKQYNVWKRAVPKGRFYNLYGPTEITVDCTWYEVDREFSDNESIPIGKTCRNMEILLLDEAGNPVKDEEVGEIYIRGTGVAPGYYNNPLQTESAFVQNPLHNSYPEKVYRSGDMARYNRYGELIFVARGDKQIKHLGNRIELGEIETAVNSLPGIEEAICFYDSLRERIVLAYKGKDITRADIVRGIRNKIPRYMIPGKMYSMESMPETANGKIDRKKIEEEFLNGKDREFNSIE
ncbi:MAG: amino acid adenylation domain-containing protein [Anaerovoracaceae bacterium]